MILGIYGHKKSGKTVLVEELTRSLTEKGYEVATIKHTHHKEHGLDVEGSDTRRHAQAGAKVVSLSTDVETLYILKRNVELSDIESHIEKLGAVDIVLAEGFKGEEISKIAVGDIEDERNTVLRYTDNLDEITKFIEDGIQAERILERLPGLDCKKCGVTCAELAALILEENKNYQDCVYFSDTVDVETNVNGRNIPMGKFAKDILSRTVRGMVSSLKGVDESKVKSVELKIKFKND
ncbi:MAG: molybdopterin-guanine dinucleotide biosynthesis protein B [Thermoplasmata archaeon]